ncbi:MAG TPA: cytochrome c oxidase subunit 3 [Ktedonobacterales bacterium]
MASSIPASGHAASHGDGVDHDLKLRRGMLFYVLTDVLFVIFMLASYVWLRAIHADGWFPQGTKLPDDQTVYILTGLCVLSAIFFFIGFMGLRGGSATTLTICMAIATVLAIAALSGQFRFMGNLPFTTADGSFASTYILLSGYHIYHLLLGIFLGIGVTHRALRGRYSSNRTAGLSAIGYYWYWMALFPVLVTLMVQLLPPGQ